MGGDAFGWKAASVFAFRGAIAVFFITALEIGRVAGVIAVVDAF